MERKNKEKLARDVAGWLQRRSGKVPLRIQKVLFLAVIFLAATYCALLVGGLGKNDIGLTRITVPMVEGTDKHRIANRVNKLKDYIDSLGRSDSGRKELDSLLHNNPGLMDSIRVWEEQLRNLR